MGAIKEGDLIQFALRWEPFGGGDEFIFPEFGVAPLLFYRRLLRILESAAEDLTMSQNHRLTRLCDQKVARLQIAQRPDMANTRRRVAGMDQGVRALFKVEGRSH